MSEVGDLLIHVDCGGAQMSLPRPRLDGGIEWRLRYGNPDQVRYCAASALESYSYLTSNEISMTEATRRLRLLRQAREAARAPAPSQEGTK
jgi:hypothetical protein